MLRRQRQPGEIEELKKADLSQPLRKEPLDAVVAMRQAKEEKLQARDELIKQQAREAQPEDHQSEFESMTTPCYLIDFQFTRSGDTLIKLRVPFKYRDLVWPLREGYNLPLEAHITKFQKAADERSRLDELYARRQTSSVSLDQPQPNGEAT